MGIKIPKISNSSERKNAPLHTFHQELVEYLNPLIQERRRLIEYLETIKIDNPSNIELISSIENQISEISDQIRKELKDIKAQKPGEWEKARSEIKEKRNKNKEMVTNVLNCILTKGINSCLDEFYNLDTNNQFRLTLLLMEVDVDTFFECIDRFEVLNDKEKRLKIGIEFIQSYRGYLVLEHSEELIDALDAQGQIIIAKEIIKTKSDDDFFKNIDKFTKLNLPEDYLKITFELLDEKLYSLVIRLSDKLIKPLDKESQLAIALKIIEVGGSLEILNSLKRFPLLSSPQDIKKIAIACIDVDEPESVLEREDIFLSLDDEKSQKHLITALLKGDPKNAIFISEFYVLFSQLNRNQILNIIKNNNLADENILRLYNLTQADLIVEIIESGKNLSLLIHNFKKFTEVENKDSQLKILWASVANGVFRSLYHLLTETHDQQTQRLIGLKLIYTVDDFFRYVTYLPKILENGYQLEFFRLLMQRHFSNFIFRIDEFLNMSDKESQIEIAHNLIKQGKVDVFFRKIQKFSAIQDKESMISIAKSIIDLGKPELLTDNYLKLKFIDITTMIELLKEKGFHEEAKVLEVRMERFDFIKKRRLPTFATRFIYFKSLYIDDPNSIYEFWSSLEGSIKGVRSRRLFSSIVFRDLVKVSVFSSDTDLVNYLKSINQVEGLISKFESGEELDNNELEILNRTLKRIESIYNESQLSRLQGIKILEEDTIEITVQQRIKSLREILLVPEGKTISERLTEMFYKPLRVKNINELLEIITRKQTEAHNRNLSSVVNGAIDLRDSFIKGVPINFFTSLINNGMLARDLFGETDLTALDTDFIHNKNSNNLIGTDAAVYGDILIVLRNGPRFKILNKEGTNRNELLNDIDTYEVIPRTVFQGHVGIRTGVPSTEISAIVLTSAFLQKPEIQKKQIFFSIANNGFYIPVCTEDGKVIFTIDDYNRYKIEGNRLLRKTSENTFKPEELLSQLSENPYLSKLFSLKVGVSEGYTGYQHTKMVMTQFEKYFANSDLSESILSKEEFRIFLALHDIGKSQGFLIEGSTLNQHQYSKDVIMYLLHSIGLNPRSIDTFFELLDQDILGEFIKGYYSIEKTAELIVELSERLGTTVQKSYKTLEIMYMCDASSYTADAGGIPSLDRLFNFRNGTISFSQATSEKIQLLKERLGI